MVPIYDYRSRVGCLMVLEPASEDCHAHAVGGINTDTV